MMKPQILTFVVPALTILLTSSAHSQSAEDQSMQTELPMQRMEAKLNLRVHELEVRMAQLAVEEASIEVDKRKLMVAAARAENRSIEHAEMELKQAMIHLEMRKLELAMIELHAERAKLELGVAAAKEPESKSQPSPVRLEYDDDADVVIIRGRRDLVEKIRVLLENAAESQ